ncbi:ribonuclease H-like YkuK family protein [Pullulanibacillus sp. KACC 23026]|uniref:ribonuclease H-like YkuK family protein n=1 Tax=Pullulanibacillus sp. KACC 23026 TaxID=3028315 RepID=UPI0023AEAA09|nr:ribonuclease H-like YkuK family protein [Pullulanibacillus sp. KACC 23026]WEG14728.1 ribonuclease H-like YkuK family protein [Pullulanibacillus sp. KACC 23026]
MANFKLYNYTFQNLQEKEMSFEQVFEYIVQFMKRDPRGNFKLMVGTDSQVHPTYTRFITGIVIQQERKGAWACIRRVVVPRQMTNLHERISFETSLTEDIVSMFSEERKNQLIDIVLPHIYKGSTFTMEGHLDIGSGKRNKTRIFVEEMTARIEAMGIEPRIKPMSFVASSYANRYTK